MTTPQIGQFVHYRLTRVDARLANKQRERASENYLATRKTGVQIYEGNRHVVGDIVPLLVVRVWPDEFVPESSVCRDYVPGDEPLFDFPLSGVGVNGQAFLDGNFTLHVCSAPEGEFNGGWTRIPDEPRPTPLDGRSINEWREENSLPPIDAPEAYEPFVMSSSGPVFLRDEIRDAEDEILGAPV